MLLCSRCHIANYFHLPSTPGSACPAGLPPLVEPTPSASQPSIFALRPHAAPLLSQQPTFQPWNQPDAAAHQASHSGSQVNVRRISAVARHQLPSSQLPHPAGVAQLPLISLPTVRVPKRKNARVSTTRRAMTRKQKIVDMKYFIVIHPQQVTTLENPVQAILITMLAGALCQ